MEKVIIHSFYNEGKQWNGQIGTVVKKTKSTVSVIGLSGTYGAECIFWLEEVKFV